MRLRIKDHLVELQRRLRRKQQIQILHRLRKEEAFHRVCLRLGLHIAERGIGIVRPAELDQRVVIGNPHRQVLRVMRVVIEVVS